jgi:CRISPR type III-B/RAMP module RAMP protein Cmr6
MTPQEMGERILPASTREVLPPSVRIDNLCLRLYSFLPAGLIGERTARKGEGKAKVKQEILYRLQQDSAVLLDPALLAELAARQQALLDALAPSFPAAAPLRLRAASNLICGMATGNLLESGMTLLRPYGLPIIPDSAVKGAAASWLAELLSGGLNPKHGQRCESLRRGGFLDWFGVEETPGRPGKAGQVVFLSAIPVSGALEVDITTVHDQPWLQDPSQPPAGFNNPTPIPFLSVGAGAVFQFAFAVRRNAVMPDKTTNLNLESLAAFGIRNLSNPAAFLRELLISTARFKGFGGQTAKGHGKWEPV